MEKGERQVATDLNDIRKDHRARYEWAASRLSGAVVDAGCGVGYGSWILAEAGHTVRRFDADAEAIAFANEHWTHENIIESYEADAALVKFPDGGYNAVVAFEMLEHLEDPLPALQNFTRMAPRLLASVPNEAVWPHAGRYKFHYRHYTAREFEELLNRAGYEVKSWWGQDGKFDDPQENTQGRTLIADAVATAEPQTETFRRLPDVTPPPKSVAIVAMGASKDTYAALLSNNGGNRHRLWDEVWTINAMGGVVQCDKVIHMDDLRIQEIRAEAQPQSFVAGMLEWMREPGPPIITCKAYDDYPRTEEYPLKEVLDEVGTPYLNTTVAYAIALAIKTGVERLGLYGADFSYPSLHKREKGRGCVEFLLGLAAARGISVELAQNTTLMDANEPSEHGILDENGNAHPARLYGYDTEHLTLTHSNDGGWEVKREPREKIPTAEEMELKYAHVPADQIQVQKEEEGQGEQVEQEEAA